MTDEVETPVEVTDPETIETPAETFTQVEEPDESETIAKVSGRPHYETEKE